MEGYNNPILPGFNPDPSIVRVDDDYFLVTSSFEYFPGAPIYHSRDLIQWKLIGHALTRTSQLQIHTPEPGGGVWATTLRFYQGTYYIITSSFDRYRPQDDDRVWPRGFYVKTSNIWDSKSWSDPVYFDQVGFDHDLFWDDEGTVYLSYTCRKLVRTPNSQLKDFAIHICTVDLETGNSTSDARLIRESVSGVSEGSHIFRRNRYYYLFTAEGGTESGHSEWVCRSDQSPFGPWQEAPHNPLLHNGVDNDVQNIGHVDLVEDVAGQWWAVMLGVRPVRKGDTWEPSVFGRESFLVPVDWVNDWPVFNRGAKVSLQGSGLSLYQKSVPVDWVDDFSSSTLGLGWYRKNTPLKIDFSLTERPGHLRLYGSPYTLSDPASPTLFLRKQTQRYCSWQTQLSFYKPSAHTEAGAVVWMDYFTYCSIGIRLSAGDKPTRIIRFQRPSGSGHEVDEHPLVSHESDVVLVIQSGDEYRFGFREILPNEPKEGHQVVWIGEVENNLMTRSPPIGAQFTGTMLGLYVFGERKPCRTPADFAYAKFLYRSQ